MRGARSLVGAVGALIVLVALGGPAFAADPAIVVSDKDDVVVSADGSQLVVTAVSSAPADLQLAATVPDQDTCDVSVSPKRLVPSKVREVTLTLAAGCDAKKGIEVELTGTPASGAPVTAKVVADAAKVAPTYWGDLREGAVAGGVIALILVLGAWAFGMGSRWHHLGTALLGLDATWKFSDSWVANITVATTAFSTVLFGSGALEAILGKKPTEGLAVITVASGIAAMLVALSGLTTLATVTSGRKKVPRGKLTAGGVALGALFTLTGSYLLVFTITWVVIDLNLSVPDDLVYAGTGLVSVILAVYGARSLHSVLKHKRVAAPEPKDKTVVELQRIADVLGAPSAPKKTKPTVRSADIDDDVDHVEEAEDVEDDELEVAGGRSAALL